MAKTTAHSYSLRPRLGLSGWILIILSAVGGIIYLPYSVLVVIGMAPTIIAFLCDPDERRSMTITIGLMNAAGVLPFLLKLWEQGHTIKASLNMLNYGMTWLVMYGSALSGWAILFIVPPIVHIIMAQKVKFRIGELEKRQTILRTAWGDEVENPRGPV